MIERHGIADNPERASEIAALCGGSLAEASLLADPELTEFRSELLEMLAADRLMFGNLKATRAVAL